jgi:copper homeostasis protein
LVERAAGRIEVLPGSGVRAEQVAALVQRTGVSQLHASASRAELDSSTHARPKLNFGGSAADNGEHYRVVDPAQVAAMKRAIERLSD